MSEIVDPGMVTGPLDTLFERHETARVQLLILTNVLNLWERRDLGRYLRSETLAVS